MGMMIVSTSQGDFVNELGDMLGQLLCKRMSCHQSEEIPVEFSRRGKIRGGFHGTPAFCFQQHFTATELRLGLNSTSQKMTLF